MQTLGPDRRVLTLRNAIYLAAGLALHLALLAFILSWRAPPPASVAEVTQVGLVEGSGSSVAATASASAAPTRATPPAPVSPPVTKLPIVAGPPQDMVTPVASPSLEAPNALLPPSISPTPTSVASAAGSAPGAAAAGGACAIAADVKLALQADDAIRTAVAAIPPSARSVANAVMLWDGQWAPSDGLGPPGTKIRSAVVAAIGRSPPACRDEPVRGPSLIIVGDGRRPVTLAIGSGVWRWGDLLAETMTARQQ